MEHALLQRKNKQNFAKLTSIIGQYQSKLDMRVDQVISDLINYTKRIADNPLLPVINPKKIYNNQIKKLEEDRKKSTSFQTDISFLGDTNLEVEVQHLRNTYKSIQSNKAINQVGRPIGKVPIVRPKFIKKKADIVPRQIRLNPFYQRNAIKAFELDKGLLSLIEKGKIGKDVNIITAFQKGRPILQTQKAIFHEGQQRFAQLDSQKTQKVISRERNTNLSSNNGNGKNIELKQRIYEQNWALTMPKQEQIKITHTNQTKKQDKISIDQIYKELIYIKISNYKVINDANFKIFSIKNLHYKGQIRHIISQLIKAMNIYSIDIAYADGSKILELVTKVSQVKVKELINCLVQRSQNFLSLKNVRTQFQKKFLALDKIISCFKFNVERKEFLRFIKKKKVANKIYGWVVSRWTIKKKNQQIKRIRQQTQSKYVNIQKQFREQYSKLQQQKHFQIHIINQPLLGKQKYKQYMNIQITRIFNLKNVNKHIIYILPYHLDEETINYYYKIMELEEIPNYKDRVSFIEVDPSMNFKHKINISTKLYYNSRALRILKKKIKDIPSYFVISYPSHVDIQLSSYLNIPISGGNLINLLTLQKRTSLNVFKVDFFQRHLIEGFPNHTNLTSLSDQLIQYCQNIKKPFKYIVKINGRNRSRGSALLTFPFSSLPQMYSNTTNITPGLTVDQFYHILLKDGGILQKYQQNLSAITVVLNITLLGQVKIIGTFQKISSGFINVGYNFPQRKIENAWLTQKSIAIGSKLFEQGHFGGAQLTFFVDELQQLFLQKVQCYLTHLGSSLYYYKFLSDGEFNQNGQYMAKIIDTFEREEGGLQEEVITMEPRSFCYLPYLLHFGLSDRQANSFFQLCRMGGVSFDLQNKYGATFILLGSLKSSMGMITTAKDKKGAQKLMLKSLEFILKQNSHNMSNQTLAEKQIRMKERQNIINLKQRLEDN